MKQIYIDSMLSLEENVHLKLLVSCYNTAIIYRISYPNQWEWYSMVELTTFEFLGDEIKI